jgi:hypothetical protein
MYNSLSRGASHMRRGLRTPPQPTPGSLSLNGTFPRRSRPPPGDIWRTLFGCFSLVPTHPAYYWLSPARPVTITLTTILIEGVLAYPESSALLRTDSRVICKYMCSGEINHYLAAQNSKTRCLTAVPSALRGAIGGGIGYLHIISIISGCTPSIRTRLNQRANRQHAPEDAPLPDDRYPQYMSKNLSNTTALPYTARGPISA